MIQNLMEHSSKLTILLILWDRKKRHVKPAGYMHMFNDCLGCFRDVLDKDYTKYHARVLAYCPLHAQVSW